MPPPHRPVLIIGTGPSGLLLAHALKKASIPFKLFERDSAINIRGQGYRFKVTGEGVLALQNVLEPAHYKLLTQSCCVNGEGFTMFDALTGEPASQDMFVKKGGGGSKPEGPEPLCVDRTILRSVLMRGLEESVSFDHKFLSFTQSEDGMSVSANFTNNTSIAGSLLVAADGGWSSVRKQYLPDFIPVDTEARFFYGKTPITPELTEKFNSTAQQHMAMVIDRSQGLPVTLLVEPMRFSQRASAEKEGVELPPDYMYWAIGSRMDRLDTSGLGKRPSPEDCAAFVKRISEGLDWDPSFAALVEQQNIAQTTAVKVISMAPQMPKWESTRVTLIGDAAHCMSPTSGVGASIALRDSGLLGSILAERGVGAEAMGEYEKVMREWPELAALKSAKVGKMIFGMKDFAELKAVTE